MLFKNDLIEAIKKNNLSQVLLNESFDAVQEFWMTSDTVLPDKIESAFKIDTTEYVCSLKRANVKGLYICEFGMIANKFMKFWKFKSSTHIRPGISTLIKIIEASVPFLNANIAGIAIKIPASNTKDYSFLLNKVLMKTHLKMQWASLNVDNTLSTEYQYVFLMKKSKNINDVFKSKVFDPYKLGDSTEISHAGTLKKKKAGSIHIGTAATTEIPAVALDAVVPFKFSPPTHNTTPSVEYLYPNTPVVNDIKSAETVLAKADTVKVNPEPTPLLPSYGELVKPEPISNQPVVTSAPDKNVVLNDDQTKIAYGKLFDTATNTKGADKKLPLVLAFLMRDTVLTYPNAKAFYDGFVKNNENEEFKIWADIRVAAQKSDMVTLSNKSGKSQSDILGMKKWLKGYGKIGYLMYQDFVNKFGTQILKDPHFYDQIFNAANLTAGYAQAAPLTTIPVKLKNKTTPVAAIPAAAKLSNNPTGKVNYDAIKNGVSYLDGAFANMEPTKLLTQALAILLVEWIAQYSSEDELRAGINNIGDGSAKTIFFGLSGLASSSPYYATFVKLKPFGFETFPIWDKFVANFGENYLLESNFAYELWFRYTNYYKKVKTVEPVKKEFVYIPPTPKKSSFDISVHKKKDIDGVVFKAMEESSKFRNSLNDRFLPTDSKNTYSTAYTKQLKTPSFKKYENLKPIHKTMSDSYTNGCYGYYNNVFRKFLKTGNITSYDIPKQASYQASGIDFIKNVNSWFDAYKATPLEEGLYVWRGTNTPDVDPPEKIQNIDEDYIDAGCLSTSMNPECDFVLGKNTKLEIYIPKGSVVIPILDYSSHKPEREIILPPFSILRPYDIKADWQTQYIKCVYMGSARESYLKSLCEKLNLIQESFYDMLTSGSSNGGLKRFKEFIMEEEKKKHVNKSKKDGINPQKVNDIGPSLKDIKKANELVKSGKMKVKKD